MKDLGNVLTFLKHKNPEKLSGLMLENNLKRKCFHEYTIIFADGFWYAWFMADINDALKK